MKASTTFYSLFDPSVFFSLAIAASTSLVVLAYKAYHYEPCQEIEISVKQGTIHAGEIIQFKANTDLEKEDQVSWDFGTQENSYKTGIIVNHTFDKPGRYDVALSGTNFCKSYKTIYVEEALLVVDESQVAHFSGPEIAEVGKPVVFEDTTEGATKWEWWFGENNFPEAFEQKATYTFESTGRKKIKLLVNGNKVGEKIIEVYAAPTDQVASRSKPSPKRQRTIELPDRPISESFQPPIEANTSTEKKFPEISQVGLETIIKDIVEGNSTVEDLTPYLCANESMHVTYNGTSISLSDLNKELSDIKKIKKIKSLVIKPSKNPTTNCIFLMTIELEKKGFLFF